MTRGEALVDPVPIREQLKRILASPGFDASDRNRRFLEYVVEETLEGRADRIKAYSIATSVFGRNDSFDPQQDAIVRIEAGRMRRALEHYYLTSGQNDRIRITIPVGCYVPSFALADDTADDPSAPIDPVPSEAGSSVLRPVVQVSDFDPEGTDRATLDVARSLSRHLIVGLTRFTDLAVVGADLPSENLAAGDATTPRDGRRVDFVLTGSVALSDGRLHVESLLLDARTGHYVWSDYIDHDLGGTSLMRLRHEIADRIVCAIAQPSGVIFSYRTREGLARSDEGSESFESVMRFHSYWRSFDRDQFEPVRQGLERAIVADPHYAEAYACLSQMYSNSIRFGYMGIATTLNPLRRAVALAQRAIQLSPSSSRGYLALATAYWFSGEVSGAMAALKTSLALNPNDMEVMAELGLRHALRAEWEAGVGLIDEAYRRNPALPSGYRIGLSVWHYCHGRFAEALSEAWKIEMPGVIYPYVMMACSAARLGRAKEAASALNSVLNLDPEYASNVVRDLEGRNIHPGVIEEVVRGLHAAGLACGAEVSRMTPARKPYPAGDAGFGSAPVARNSN